MPTPATIATLCLFAGLVLAVAGVHVLLGLGWALVAAGMCLVVLAVALFRGIVQPGGA